MADNDTQIAALESRLEALAKLRDSGVLSTRHGDTQIQFRSMGELLQAMKSIKSEIRVLSGTARRPLYVIQTGKGL